ncbi:MAG: hypothetical protein FJ405_14255 [Verrucomicrobia bacterium]|nr:hypothetical protein [Verrucomicrobiota bacterium]
MKDLSWYWHRLRAMSSGEILLHARKKLRQRVDARWQPDPGQVQFTPDSRSPQLPSVERANEEIRDALAALSLKLQKGRWGAFGHLDLHVDLPPRWHKDYLAGVDLKTDASSFQLNHRALPAGCDVKLIWELSRWHQPLQLAQAAYVLGDHEAGRLCVGLLKDWVRHNPAFKGWNWTSALESGMRLIQFYWIDGLLAGCGGRYDSDLTELRRAILPAHARFTWRHRSFGSSANNHLLGELTGLMMAVTRWPELREWCVGQEELKRAWEAEVLAQFHTDGGNKEQALNYQLFSFEFAWQGRKALLDAGGTVGGLVETRLADAARFFWEVQARHEAWDYGDSDSATVSPVFLGETGVISQWYAWVEGKRGGQGIRYWLGDPPDFKPGLSIGAEPRHAIPLRGWFHYPRTGIACLSSGLWWLRWDLSPLGYLSTAAHGHLDALHLSIWWNKTAFVIDPGTGAYYGDVGLRTWLASRTAHNAPCPKRVPEWPRRMGPFLWREHHSSPDVVPEGADSVRGGLDLDGLRIERSVSSGDGGSSWRVTDRCLGRNGEALAFTVRWQFAPGTRFRVRGPRSWTAVRNDQQMDIEVSADWADVQLHELASEEGNPPTDGRWEGWVSPAFRKVVRAPYLLLGAGPDPGRSCVFTTSFLGSSRS